MEKFTAWMEEHFVPIAARIGSQKHLVAIRDAFIAILPITMAGSFAVLFNAIVRDVMAENALNLPQVTQAFQWLIAIDGNVWWGTIAMLALVFSFAIGYQIAKAYGVTALAGGLISTSAFIIVTPQTANASLTFADPTLVSQQALDMITESGGVVDAEAGTLSLGAWGNLNVSYLNAGGLFTALIVGLIFTIIFSKLMKSKLTITLPDSVPPAVSDAFRALIPGTAVLFGAGILAYALGELHTANAEIPGSLGDMITKFIQTPFLNASQGLGWVILVTFMVELFWFFGIHGSNVMAPVMSGVYLTALTSNMDAWATNQNYADLPYQWTSGSWEAFVYLGGSGASIGLIIAIFIFSKRKEYRTIAALAAPMGVFEINEPMVFGLPIVLNPVFLIPWILVPPILAVIAWLATMSGIVPPTIIQLPWIAPPIIGAFIATGFQWTAAVLAAINLAISVLIWSVFVIMANGMAEKEAAAEAQVEAAATS